MDKRTDMSRHKRKNENMKKMSNSTWNQRSTDKKIAKMYHLLPVIYGQSDNAQAWKGLVASERTKSVIHLENSLALYMKSVRNVLYSLIQ